jgi:hypothetical protein
MTKDDIKLAIGTLLNKEGKSLEDLELALSKQAQEKSAASAADILTKLLGFGGNALMSLIKWPMAAGAFASIPAAYSGYKMYAANQNSDKKILEAMEEKRKIEEAKAEIDSRKLQQNYVQ